MSGRALYTTTLGSATYALGIDHGSGLESLDGCIKYTICSVEVQLSSLCPITMCVTACACPP